MADNIGKLSLLVTADHQGLTSGLGTASGDLQKFGTSTGNQIAGMEQAFSKAGDGVKGIFDGLKSGGLTGALDAATSQVAGLANSFVTMAGLGGTFAVGFIAGLGAILALANSVSDKMNEINKLGKAIGASGEEAQVLVRVFERAGLSAEDARTTLLKFTDALGDIRHNLDGPQAKVLERLGLDPEEISKKSPAEAFETIVAAMGRLGDAAERNSAAQALFGKRFTDLEPIVRRGSAAFNDARRDIDQFGASPAVLKMAEETAKINRELANAPSLWKTLMQGFNETLVTIANMWANFRKDWHNFWANLGFFGGKKIGEGGESGPKGPAAPPVDFEERRRARAADAEAQKLTKELELQAKTFGMTATEAKLFKLQMDGASEATLEQARRQAEIIKALEERKKLESELEGLRKSGQTGLEKFQATLLQINKIQAAGLTGSLENARLLGQAFRDLERSLGGSPSSFALTGINADSLEAAKIQADLEIRARNGADDPQNRVVQVLEAARQIQEEQLAELRALGEAMRNAPVLGVPRT